MIHRNSNESRLVWDLLRRFFPDVKVVLNLIGFKVVDFQEQDMDTHKYLTSAETELDLKKGDSFDYEI